MVLAKEKAILVIAGAGSGKSLTIIGKIVYLVKECNVKPEEILCISFTNDATKNLKKNIEENYHFHLDIYTFHKLSLEILKSHEEVYEIAPEEFLKTCIDEYFETVSSNSFQKKALEYILGKQYKEKNLLLLKRLIKTFISLFKGNCYKVEYFKELLQKIKWTWKYKEYKKNKYLLLFIINIYLYYEESLRKENAIDFDDMIGKAIDAIQEKGLKKKWKYVIVDEYQDTSYTKFLLLQQILKQCDASFLAVGDDFQSIYRFTGCDLSIFLNFLSYFKFGKIFPIIMTYRNPQELIDVAGSFIMKNPLQQKKRLRSLKHLEHPIQIYYYKDKSRALKEVLKVIEEEDIFVLGRNNKDILSFIDQEFKVLPDGYYKYQNKVFRYLTVHKSKGLESKNVILINVEDHLLGFPSKIKEEKILKYVHQSKLYYPYEEERRLFYVALTRTKKKCYILTTKEKESIFIKEIKKDKQHVEIFMMK